MLQVVITIALLAILAWGIRKGYNTISLLFSLGIVSLLGVVVTTGVSPSAVSSGSAFFDIFELISETFISRFGSMLIITMAVIGYTSYMNAIGASKALSDILTKPFSMIKNKYLLLSASVLLIFLMIFAIPSPSSVVMLLFGTIVPIMVGVGIPIESIVATFVVATTIVSGPSNPITLLVTGELGILDQTDISTFAFSTQIIISIICVISLMVLVPISNYFFDKKDKVAARELVLTKDVSYQGVNPPKFYAVFPILPLALVIIFSRLVVGSITISVVCAQFLCLFSVMLIDKFAAKKTFKDALNGTKTFYEGMGNYLGGMGMVPVAGAFFAVALGKIGGLSILADSLSNVGFGFLGVMIFVALLAVFCSFVTADAMGTNTILLPIVIAVIAATGGSANTAACIMIQTASFGSAISLVYPSSLMLSSLTNVEITTIVKRNLLPVLGSVLVLFIASFLVI